MLKELKVILRLFNRKQKIISLFLILFTLIGSVFETAGIMLITPIILLIQNPDALNKNKYLIFFSGLFNLKSGHDILIFFLSALVIFYLLKSLFLALLYWYQNLFVYNLKYNLTNKLLSIYLHQPWSFHFTRNVGQLMRNVNLDMIYLTETIKSWIILFAEGFFVLTVFILLFMYQPKALTIVVLSCGPVLWLFNRISNNILKKSRSERHFSEGEKIRYLKQGLDGIKDIIINGNEEFFLLKFKSPNYTEVKATRQFMTFQNLPKLWLETLAMVAFAALLAISLSNRNLMTVLPFMGLLAISMFKVLPSINRVIVATQNILYNQKSTHSVYTDILLEKNIAVQKTSDDLHFNSAITVENVSFSYPNPGTLVLKNINLSISKGSVIGIIGKTGSGKSTFIDLLVGLLTPTSGNFYADGTNIHADINAWKRKISYIPQSVYLFDDSIKNNIALGIQQENINDGEIFSAIALAGLGEFIKELPEGIDTKVGDGGIGLSGGQRQRVGIARALYKNSEILILDEATNALDIETEKTVLTNINSLAHKKTIIIISHRMASLSNCNKIYKIEKGSLAEFSPAGSD